MLRPFTRTVLIVAGCLTTVLGNWNDTSTGLDLNKLPHFPLTKIRSGLLQDGSRTKFDGITAVAMEDPREVQVRGVGKSEKQWEVHLSFLDEVWRADLDGNGTQDYVFFSGGPYFNGRMTPLFSLSILLMDREGMPTPFFTVVYHGENGDGIKHFVDLNHAGHAELLISSYDEIPSDPNVGAFCSGHWVSQLYQFKDLGAEEIRRAIGNITFPFTRDWTYGSKKCPAYEQHIPVESPTISDHGTAAQNAVFTTLRKPLTKAGLLAISPVAGCNMVNAGVIVYDRLNTRYIAFPTLFTTYSQDLSEAIRRDGAHVELRGLRKVNGECSANLILAK